MAYVTKDANTAVAERNGTLIGVTAPIGAHILRASLSSTEAAGARLQMFAVGFDYTLSKRTSIYTTLASNTGSGGAIPTLNGSGGAANSTATGFDIGIRHTF
jgi:predicted porin